MVNEQGSCKYPQLSEMYSFLDYLKCFRCHYDLKVPVTLPCGHSICFSCLPTKHENHTHRFVTAQQGSSFQCLFPNCHSEYIYSSDFKVDVTLAKIIQLRLQRLSQPQAQSHLNNIPFSSYNELLSFIKVIQPEFECQICYLILHDPTTTSCGHTFCRECLLRTTDHSNRCPTCRSTISFLQIRDQRTNFILYKLIETFFSQIHSEKEIQAPEKSNDYKALPILVGGLLFPHITYSLHIFEPSYRLLIRRCLETETKQFGVVARMNSKTLPEYGTLVQVKSSQSLPDGRYLIQVEGLQRFRILESSNQDGYHIARTELIEDSLLLSEKETDDTSVEEMVLTVKSFVNSLDKGYPQLLARLKQLYGPPPQAMNPFSYWASCIIPIDDQEKYKLLCVDSAKLRLLMIVRWIETTRKQWGFVGCPVM